jgi:AcrR family transcriptional regulator
MSKRGNALSEETCQRLLDAAGEVFSERGFHGATIREICRRAGANIAAVNYHFGDKRQLYQEALRHAHRYAKAEYPSEPHGNGEVSPEQRLASFVAFFLRKILDEGRPAWHGKLLVREMSEPTEALDKLVEEEIRPQHEHMEALVSELLGPGATVQQADLCVWSILGQCLFYRLSQPVVVRLHPEHSYNPDEITRLAEHITRFSICAIKQMAPAYQPKTPESPV